MMDHQRSQNVPSPICQRLLRCRDHSGDTYVRRLYLRSCSHAARARQGGRALHEVTALNLATQALAAVTERNKLDPALVDDVVLGCVDPVGEAGGDIARVAALTAG